MKDGSFTTLLDESAPAGSIDVSKKRARSAPCSKLSGIYRAGP